MQRPDQKILPLVRESDPPPRVRDHLRAILVLGRADDADPPEEELPVPHAGDKVRDPRAEGGEREDGHGRGAHFAGGPDGVCEGEEDGGGEEGKGGGED